MTTTLDSASAHKLAVTVRNAYINVLAVPNSGTKRYTEAASEFNGIARVLETLGYVCATEEAWHIMDGVVRSVSDIPYAGDANRRAWNAEITDAIVAGFALLGGETR